MNKFTEYFRYYWKAVIAFVAPAAISLGGSLHPDTAGGENITQSELIIALLAAIITSAGVASKANGPNPNAVPVHETASTVVNNYTSLTPEETVKKIDVSEPHIVYRGSDPVNKPAEEMPPRTE